MASGDVARLARLLGGWDAAPGRLPQRLAQALADLILHGDLADGDRLPSERHLAEALSVSRGTVTGAYDLLRAADHVSSRVGAGSVVTARRAHSAQGDARLSSFRSREYGRIDLSSGAPGGLVDLVMEHTRAVVDGPELPGAMAGDGYEPHGVAPLREALRRHYEDLGVPTRADQLLVTNGSQQALTLIAGALVSRSDTVLVEDPTYRGAIEAFRRRGARIVPVPTGPAGPDVRLLERLLRQLAPRMLYLLPVAHNPTGSIVSEAGARRVAELVRGTGTILVEDRSPADLLIRDDAPPAPIGSRMGSGAWITIGSASKVFWGGLRTGWIRADQATVQALSRARVNSDLGGSIIGQLVTARCLADLSRAREARRAQLRAGLRTALDALHDHAPEWSWAEPLGGSALWVRLPGTDTTAFARLAQRRNISVVPGPVFSAVGGFTDHLRLPFWQPASDVADGIARLADLWRRSGSETSNGHRARP
ncbi:MULTISPECIES: PLP-dependent aminotransferase family protein [Actinomadura]|uniref:PLP-dependent aminotransferase family protein n=1 Tax=Actinomadura yumaensis TaxID=111807 RepID=A0ABW2CDF0_9ACTN|nr:PLP-dependent aminotransferase family protein [Actinomadura sp. J1-007]